jgi:hypothetical protein
MTDPADPPPFRHPAVYRTVRGLALSGSRALPASDRPTGIAALAAPLRVSAVVQVRPGGELAMPVATPAVAVAVAVAPEPDDAAVFSDADGLFDVAGSRDVRRYSEPND